MLQVRGNVPELLIGHVAPLRPRHRGSEILRPSRKISLTGYHRRDLDVGGFAGPEPIAEGVEDLTLAETSQPRGIVRREVAWPGTEAWLRSRIGRTRTDQELVSHPPRTGEIALGRRVGA